MFECKAADLKSVQDGYEKEDKIAGHILARYYQYGEYVEKDETVAIIIFVDLAQKGHLGSRGWCHEQGYGSFLKSAAKAKERREMRADEGEEVSLSCPENADDRHEEGADEGEEAYLSCLKKAVQCYQEGAREGDEVSLSCLGVCYHTGKGVPKDEERAVKLFREAADKGYAIAMSNLGTCYLNGKGVEKDVEEGASLFEQAAEKGDPAATCNLGVCYQFGEGKEKSVEQAIEYFKQAADMGCQSAITYLDIMGIAYTPQNQRGEQSRKRKAHPDEEAPARKRRAVANHTEGGSATPINSHFQQYTVGQVEAFVSGMELGPSTEEVAAKFRAARVNGEELASYTCENDMMESLDISMGVAHNVLKKRDEFCANNYLANLGRDAQSSPSQKVPPSPSSPPHRKPTACSLCRSCRCCCSLILRLIGLCFFLLVAVYFLCIFGFLPGCDILED